MGNKGIIFGISILFVLAVLGIFCTKNIISGFSISESSLTKAICNENNYCEDYEIVCQGKEITGLNPTGAAVQFPEDWKDSRSDKDKEINCN